MGVATRQSTVNTNNMPTRKTQTRKHQNHFWKPVINLDKLWSLVPAEQREKYLAKGNKTETAPVLDLLPLGYSKVLGKGRIPSVPLIVRARYFSKDAERKTKEAGGVVQLTA